MDSDGNDAGYIEHPIEVARLGQVKMFVFPDELGSALLYGEPEDGMLVRLQSACQYGEIYGSVECDCRAQLDASLDHLAETKSGVIVYLLKHEGRGSGLGTKAQAYRDRHIEGINTFESYMRQGITEDERSYDVATEFLKKRLDLHQVRLLTNNPAKVATVQAAGIDVDRIGLVPIRPGSADITSEKCDSYLRAKAQHGHLIPVP